MTWRYSYTWEIVNEVYAILNTSVFVLLLLVLNLNNISTGIVTVGGKTDVHCF